MTTMIYPMRTAAEKRDAYLARYGRLKLERSGWDSHWSDLGRHILPRAPRFQTTDRNRAGQHKYGAILNNTATRSQRTLNAGLMTGMTSSARKWFQLTTQLMSEENATPHAVSVWLDDVTERMRAIFARSNVYGALRQVYDDLGVFGTSCMLVLSDYETLIRCYPVPIGQFCIQQDYQGRIVTMYREFQRTVGEVVTEFGLENCSTRVREAWRNRQHETPVDILHVIEPRADQERRAGSPLAIDMPWRSIYLELSANEDKVLREGGFERFPVLAPRWQVQGDDVYGISPAMEGLGDVKQLQQMELRLSQAIDYKTKPPLQVPETVKNREHEILPGGVAYYEPGMTLPFDQVTPHGGIRSAFEVDLDIDHLRILKAEVEQRIKRAFYEDLFLMFEALESGRMTAREVSVREGEKLLMLGPVVDRLINELLEPLIDLTFQRMADVGMLPPIPEELAGRELSVDFVSVLAQAQRAVGITGVQQYMSETLVVAQARPDVLDNINFDEWARRTASMRGVDAAMLVDEESVQQLRDARARAQAAQEQVAMAREQAGVVKDLASAPVNESNALSELVRRAQIAGVAA